MVDGPDTHDSALLYLAPPDHTIPKRDNESSHEYIDETDTCHSLAEISRTILGTLRFANLKSVIPQPTSMAELM